MLIAVPSNRAVATGTPTANTSPCPFQRGAIGVGREQSEDVGAAALQAFAADQHFVDVAAWWSAGALPAVGGEVTEDQAAAAASGALADDDRGGR